MLLKEQKKSRTNTEDAKVIALYPKVNHAETVVSISISSSEG